MFSCFICAYSQSKEDALILMTATVPQYRSFFKELPIFKTNDVQNKEGYTG